MIQIPLVQWPLIAVVTSAGTAVVVAVIRYLMLYIGLKKMLGETSERDRPTIYREYARALGSGVPRIGIVIKIIRPRPEATASLWTRRDLRSPRADSQ
jgi:hypothetical protein